MLIIEAVFGAGQTARAPDSVYLRKGSEQKQRDGETSQLLSFGLFVSLDPR